MDAVAEQTVRVGAYKTLAEVDFAIPARLDLDVLDKMLIYCKNNGVEDLVLQSGEQWCCIWSQKVVRMGGRSFSNDEMASLLNQMTKNQQAALNVSRAEPDDFTHSVRLERGDSMRVRCCATACLGPQGQAGIHIVMRPLGDTIATMDDLKVHPYIREHCMPSSGIVIITGQTGSGKSTLLDSIIHKQATREDGQHICTFFSPIETDLYNIKGRTGVIAQCDIGRPGYGGHLKSYSDAVRNFLRRHPHVVVFGEARDQETIEGAVLAARTGHATYTTTHTSSVHMALVRMADNFSGSDRVRVMNGLIDSTRLIVHQRLLKTPSGIGRTAVISALNLTQELRAELMRTHIDDIGSTVREMTRQHGIDLLENAYEKYAAGLLHSDEVAALEAEFAMEDGK